MTHGSHIMTHTRHGSPGRVIGFSQRSLPTKSKTKTNIHTVERIRTRDPSTRAAADLHLHRTATVSLLALIYSTTENIHMFIKVL